MSKVIRISESIFNRLQALAEPLVDTPANVIERVLDHYEQCDVVPRRQEEGPPWLKYFVTRDAPPETRDAPPKETVGLFLAPVSKENMQATVEGSVELTLAEAHLNPHQRATLREALGGRGSFHCLAMTESRRPFFDKMKRDDWVLLKEKGSERFSFSGRVLCKLENRDLGEALWQVIPNKPWELIYALRDVVPRSIPKQRLLMGLGYDPKFVVPGIIRVDPSRVARVVSQYGSIEGFLKAME